MMHRASKTDTLLEVKGLHTYFYTYEGIVKAVNSVSYGLNRGEITGLVGESGSGKSVTAQSIIQLVKAPGKIVSGEVWLDGEDLMSFSQNEMQAVRGRKVSMIFQEPRAALNPLFTVGDQISRVIQLREGCTRSVAESHAVDMMRAVEIADPERRASAYPHELSGGMCQRVMVAMALSANPRPGRRRRTVRTGDRHVRRPCRRARAGFRNLCQAAPSLHAGAYCFDSARRH